MARAVLEGNSGREEACGAEQIARLLSMCLVFVTACSYMFAA
jgi:hypothetical protein